MNKLKKRPKTLNPQKYATTPSFNTNCKRRHNICFRLSHINLRNSENCQWTASILFGNFVRNSQHTRAAIINVTGRACAPPTSIETHSKLVRSNSESYYNLRYNQRCVRVKQNKRKIRSFSWNTERHLVKVVREG